MATMPPLFGVMAEFDTPQALVTATRAAYAAGYRHMDAYTPYPVEDVMDALHFHRNAVAPIVFCGGLIGGLGGLSLQYWVATSAYALNVGGRPFNTWPSWVPVTFECTILIASLSAFAGMLLLNGLPLLYHPVFNVPRFARASVDGFFLCIECTDPRFDAVAVRRFLESQQPREVADVPH
jgi:hypothetical protein